MEKERQIPLPLSYRKAYNREDFWISPCNQSVLTWFDAYPNWPHHMLLILGAPASGKTHLASVFTKHIYRAKDLTSEDALFLPQACAVEDIDEVGVDETMLFHLYNYTAEKNKKVLLTARTMPFWKLPDLKTRMSTIPTVKIGLPDDTLIMSLILKGLAERQLDIESDVIDYVLKHIERSFLAVDQFIQTIQLLSLAEKRRITVPLAKEALALMQQEKLV